MNRPARQWAHLSEKIALKESRSRKHGKRLKRWRKSLEAYKALAQPSAPEATAS